MKNKVFKDVNAAIADIGDGASIMVGGFTARGTPSNLLLALRDKNLRGLTIIRNDASGGWLNPTDVNILIEAGQVDKVVTCFPAFGRPTKVSELERKVLEGKTKVELVPQGTLAEQIRAAGCGIGGFYTPTGVGTAVAEGKETRVVDGREMLFEKALHADFALIKAHISDMFGNLVYRMSTRNFNPIMAMAARTTIVEAENLVEIGEIDPDRVVTPSIFVNRIVHIPPARLERPAKPVR